MGLFVLPLGETKKELAEQAITNLQLYIDNGGEYLIGFAESCIEKMKEIDDGSANTKRQTKV